MKRRLSMFALGTLLTLGLMPYPALADSYVIDKSHTYIGFAVKHLLVSTTKGEFSEYDGAIMFDPDNLAASKIDVTIQASSIDTRNAKRDGHLKTSDFFDVENHPTITFKSQSIEKDGNGYNITGELTIRGVSKKIKIPVTIDGPIATPFGSTVIGINGGLTINRQDYGVSWNKQMDQGGYVVGDEVKIDLSVEANKS